LVVQAARPIKGRERLVWGEKADPFDKRAMVGTTTALGSDASTETARLLTADELASRLGVQPSWVNKAARANRIPHVRVGRYRRFRWPDIEAWLEGQRADS
jgi:excisionase family DNA binding protein